MVGTARLRAATLLFSLLGSFACATVGQVINSTVHVDSPFLADWTNNSRIVLAHGDAEGIVVADVNGIVLSATREQLAAVASEQLPETKKGQRLVVAMEPGDHVTLLVGNRTLQPETVSIVFKLYSKDRVFLGATDPKVFEVPAAPAIASWSLVFTAAEIR
jgi:hypothetical protein